ncbi:hypothetical protein A2625_02180 [candidate division WOR-1 bacterium RIFCSPHIGHO2_01_FULL_53_15]|uniref:Uncharacterized protein n=1 Tax=candidate division WOR-1 bacterium RIFCSPHIGHO2_01_FULL_53_15 TaxID=1802564 RepID=A0A1F4PYR6_UNCSA|nr:MAG: hypothetical protein A2625_02180 [candidate division WOR-1 bacterium RIFCSPHIGHO2_01_FULL_53_15]OGC10711.1 MAG: hypothetical protein A3D23_00870 [candidate division WOR-1 bacterium RIFCSPHIGHO2_02_FULL_53_26]
MRQPKEIKRLEPPKRTLSPRPSILEERQSVRLETIEGKRIHPESEVFKREKISDAFRSDPQLFRRSFEILRAQDRSLTFRQYYRNIERGASILAVAGVLSLKSLAAVSINDILIIHDIGKAFERPSLPLLPRSTPPVITLKRPSFVIVARPVNHGEPSRDREQTKSLPTEIELLLLFYQQQIDCILKMIQRQISADKAVREKLAEKKEEERLEEKRQEEKAYLKKLARKREVKEMELRKFLAQIDEIIAFISRLEKMALAA